MNTGTCVIFALEREARPFLRSYPPRKRLPDAPCWAYDCGSADASILVVQTGVGPRRTRAALDWLSGFPPQRLVSAGFAGALADDLAAGSVVFADEIIDEQGERRPVPEVERFALAEAIGGRLLSWPRLVGDPADKRRLAQTYGACAVDMESAVIAAFCADTRIPFLSVRAISDDAKTTLSRRLVQLLSGERVAPWRVALALLSSPRLIPECWRLARTTRRAAERLALALRSVLQIETNRMASV